MTEKEIIQKIYEAIKLVDCMQYNPLVDFNYLRAKGAYDIIKNQVEHIEAENAELRARLEEAVGLPCKIGDIVYQTDMDGLRIFESTVKNIIFETSSIAFDEQAIGESIFLTEEAVKEKMKKLQEKKQ